MKRDRDPLMRLIAFALLLNAAFLGMRCSSSSDSQIAEADSPELLARVDALEDGLNEVRSVPAVDTSEILVRVAALEASTSSLTQTVDQIQAVTTTAIPEILVRVDALTTANAAATARIEDLEGDSGAIPAGAVSPFAGPAANLPDGWLNCDGSEVSRDEYEDLFAAIGIAHGEGDGITTFNLPDYRGMFLRGVDNGAGNDPDGEDRSVGSVQDHAVGSHGHDIDDPGHFHNILVSYSSAAGGSSGHFRGARNSNEEATESDVTGITVTTPTGANVSTETRPVNSAVNYMIKY